MLATTFSLSKHTCLEKPGLRLLGGAGLSPRSSLDREAEARSGSCTPPAASPGARPGTGSAAGSRRSSNAL